MSDYVFVARDMITKILSNHQEPTAEGIYELLEIKSGSKDVLLKHMKAINNILSKAIEELEGVENESNRYTKR